MEFVFSALLNKYFIQSATYIDVPGPCSVSDRTFLRRKRKKRGGKKKDDPVQQVREA